MSATERSQNHEVDDRYAYDDGYLRVEHQNYYAAFAGERIPLARKEFLILSCLARKPERVLSTRELWQEVWGRDEPADPTTLRVHIHRLRHKLMQFGVTIESMPHVGYRLVLAVDSKNRSASGTHQLKS